MTKGTAVGKKKAKKKADKPAKSIAKLAKPKPKKKVKKTQTIEALPERTVVVSKLLIKKGEKVHIKHSGGTLSIVEIIVEAGGTLVNESGNAPPGFKIGKLIVLPGGIVINKF